MSNAFSTWRSGDFKSVKVTTLTTVELTEFLQAKHDSKNDKIKTHNAQRAERMLTIYFMRNTLKAWSNAAKYLKV